GADLVLLLLLFFLFCAGANIMILIIIDRQNASFKDVRRIDDEVVLCVECAYFDLAIVTLLLRIYCDKC
ncbi:MAG: hypothetical protein II662_02060, partial [Bacteroidales bacterium]|nr:hypothetical protein [Bacteroidales bacterium]